MILMGKPSCIYEIIHATLQKDSNRLSVLTLCELAGVSRSGYYAWIKAEPKRQARENADRKDFELILRAYKFRGYDKGARGIHMRLLHMQPPVNMNLKKNPETHEEIQPSLSSPQRKSVQKDGESPEDQ